VSSPIPIVVCATETNPPWPGSVTGYNCEICGAKLMVTATGLKHLRQGVKALCNECGFLVVAECQKTGNIDRVELSPAVQQQIKSWAMKDKSKN
jgi:transcription elongation factor Elf1